MDTEPTKWWPNSSELSLTRADSIPAVSSQDAAHIQAIHHQQNILLTVFPVFIYLVGIPGNILTITVLASSKALKGNMFSIYLVFVSVLNILNLVVGLSRHWIRGLIAWDYRLYSTTFCVLHFIFNYALSQSVCWVLVDVTAARFLFFLYPTRRWTNANWTRLASFLVCVVTWFMLLTFNAANITSRIIMVPLNSTSGQLKECRVPQRDSGALVEVAVLAYLPAFFILVFNCALVITYRRKTRDTRDIKKDSVSNSLTTLVLASGMQFLCFYIPYAIYYSTAGYIFDKSALGTAKRTFGYSITAMLLYIDNSINFVIYCFIGSRFRRELWLTLRPITKRFCRRSPKKTSEELPRVIEMAPGIDDYNLVQPRASSPGLKEMDPDYSRSPPEMVSWGQSRSRVQFGSVTILNETESGSKSNVNTD